MDSAKAVGSFLIILNSWASTFPVIDLLDRASGFHVIDLLDRASGSPMIELSWVIKLL